MSVRKYSLLTIFMYIIAFLRPSLRQRAKPARISPQ